MRVGSPIYSRQGLGPLISIGAPEVASMKPLPGTTRPSDAELRQLLAEHVKGLTIDESKIPEHVFRPLNTVGVFSDRGPEESKLRFVPHPPIGIIPYHLNVSGFGAALHNA